MEELLSQKELPVHRLDHRHPQADQLVWKWEKFVVNHQIVVIGIPNGQDQHVLGQVKLQAFLVNVIFV